MGSIVNSLMGQNSMFPGPPMPLLNVPRNSLVLLGGFLNSYQFQLTRLIPFIARLSDLMQRESLITNANERHQVELLAHSVGMALEELAAATTPILSLMQNVHLGNNPGEVSLTDRSSRSLSQGTQQTIPQASGPSLANVNQILSGFLNPQTQQSIIILSGLEIYLIYSKTNRTRKLTNTKLSTNSPNTNTELPTNSSPKPTSRHNTTN